MRVRVQQETDEQSASAIAEALARNFEEDIEVFHEHGDEPIATATASVSGAGGSAPTTANGAGPAGEELGPTSNCSRRLRTSNRGVPRGTSSVWPSRGNCSCATDWTCGSARTA